MKAAIVSILLGTTATGFIIPSDLPDGDYHVQEHNSAPPLIKRSPNVKPSVYHSFGVNNTWWSFHHRRDYKPPNITNPICGWTPDKGKTVVNKTSPVSRIWPRDVNDQEPTSGTGEITVVVNETAEVPYVSDIKTDSHPGVRADHQITSRGCYTKIPYKLPANDYLEAKTSLVNYCSLYPFEQFYASVSLSGQVATYVCRRNQKEAAACSEGEFEFYEAFVNHTCGDLGAGYAFSRPTDTEYGRAWRGQVLCGEPGLKAWDGSGDARNFVDSKHTRKWTHGHITELRKIVTEELKTPEDKVAEKQEEYNNNVEKSKGFWTEDSKTMQKKYDEMKEKERKEKEKKEGQEKSKDKQDKKEEQAKKDAKQRQKNKIAYKIFNWEDDKEEDKVKLTKLMGGYRL